MREKCLEDGEWARRTIAKPLTPITLFVGVR
jgi:hypothetical protein